MPTGHKGIWCVYIYIYIYIYIYKILLVPRSCTEDSRRSRGRGGGHIPLMVDPMTPTQNCEEPQNDINDIWMEHAMGNGTWCEKMPCIGNSKDCNETLMDV